MAVIHKPYRLPTGLNPLISLTFTFSFPVALRYSINLGANTGLLVGDLVKLESNSTPANFFLVKVESYNPTTGDSVCSFAYIGNTSGATETSFNAQFESEEGGGLARENRFQHYIRQINPEVSCTIGCPPTGPQYQRNGNFAVKIFRGTSVVGYKSIVQKNISLEKLALASDVSDQIENTFNNRFDTRFRTQFVVLDGGGA